LRQVRQVRRRPALRYQVLRIDRDGFTRLDRRFDAATGTWRADERRGPGGSAAHRSPWDDVSATFPLRVGGGDRRRRRHAVTALALRLWQTTARLIGLAELTASTAATLTSMSERGLDVGHAAHAIGSGSLLVRAEDGGFAFIHSSVMEYLVAAAAAGDPGSGGGDGRLAEVLSVREMSPLMVDFLCGTAGRGRAVAWARDVFADADAAPTSRRNALAIALSLDPSATRAARLRGAHLKAADLTGLDLTDADLTGAELSEARLVGTDLGRTVLRDARFTGARLEKVCLAGADLTGADMTGARLIEPDMTGAS
jgi:hypothetical protein